MVYQYYEAPKRVGSLLLFFVAGIFAFMATFGMFAPTFAATQGPIDFEQPDFTTGNINGQNGWSKTGSYDSEVSENLIYPTMSDQSLRISDAVTSGSFGDHTISPSLSEAAGESGAAGDGMSAPVSSTYFEASLDFASAVPDAEQEGLSLNISPDRGDGARMSYVGLRDLSDGLEVFFYDYQVGTDPTVCDGSFPFTSVVSGLDRSVPHTVKVQMWFNDGPSNDVVTVTVDDTFTHTGTSWEDYFTGCENNPTRTVDSLIFLTRAAAHPNNLGNGFFLDNILMTTEEPIVQPTGDIVSPTAGQVVSGTLDLQATYDDGDTDNDDAVQWAVRKDSCAPSPANNVFGNVGGLNDAYNWDGADFSATFDVSTMDSGAYCFIFNPTDDTGQNDVRETVEFSIQKATPTAKDECKKGGWELFSLPLFRNQGDCVSWMVSDKQHSDNPDAGRGRNR